MELNVNCHIIIKAEFMSFRDSLLILRYNYPVLHTRNEKSRHGEYKRNQGDEGCYR